MTQGSHLSLEDRTLAPAAELAFTQSGWTLLRVSQGEGYLLRPPTPQRVCAGDVVLASRTNLCQLRASQLGEMRLQCFRVVPELLTGVLSPVERLYLERRGNDAAHSVRHFPANHAVAQQVASLSSQAQSTDGLLLRFQMLHLAARILTEGMPPAESKSVHAMTARDRFEQLIRQRPEAELHEMSPAELARLCGCSVRHFGRLYHERFGHSFVAKRMEIRLQKAQQLLIDTDDKIIDIALESGFQHVGLFTLMFKKRFHMTPSEWRKHKRQEASRLSLRTRLRARAA